MKIFNPFFLLLVLLAFSLFACENPVIPPEIETRQIIISASGKNPTENITPEVDTGRTIVLNINLDENRGVRLTFDDPSITSPVIILEDNGTTSFEIPESNTVQISATFYSITPFIMEYTTTENNLVVDLLNKTQPLIVDWGDGTTEHITSLNATHEYENMGNYDISIFALDLRIGSDSYAESIQKTQPITDIKQWGSIQWTSMRYMFSHCESLSTWSAIDSPDLSNVTDMSRLFLDAYNFNQDISNWDTSNVADMSHLFAGSGINLEELHIFNQDISNWDTSNVTNMAYMFNYNEAFNQNISTWDTSNVTNMAGMFYGYNHPFNQDISNWDTSNVTDMDQMFSRAINFNQDISTWNTSNVTTMNNMFDGASAFDQDLSNWAVANIPSKPPYFDRNSAFEGQTAKQPQWGSNP